MYAKSIAYFLASFPAHKSMLHCIILHVDCSPGSATSASVRLFLCWVVQSIVAIDRLSRLHTLSILAWSLLSLITICYSLNLHLSTLPLDKCIYKLFLAQLGFGFGFFFLSIIYFILFFRFYSFFFWFSFWFSVSCVSFSW